MLTRLLTLKRLRRAPAAEPADPPEGLPYSTLFPEIENPVSDGGAWINGKTDGLDWNDMQSNGSGMFGTEDSPLDGPGYTDNIACLNPALGFTARQWIRGVVSRAPGYNPSANHEIELHLNCTIGPHSITTVEIMVNAGGGSSMVLWNGDLNDVSVQSPDGGIGAVVDGTEIFARVDENGVYEVFKDGGETPVMTLTNATYAGTGTPGAATFSRPGDIVQTSFGWKSIEAGTW